MFWQFLKRNYTTVELEQDAGFIVTSDDTPADYLSKIRWWNFIEAWGCFALVMAVVWCEYWLSKEGTQSFRLIVGIPAIAWMFVLSPLVHYRFEQGLFLHPHQLKHGLSLYFWEFRGLGNPIRYFLGQDGEGPLVLKHKKLVLGMLLFMTLLYLCAAVTFSTEIDERFSQYYGSNGAARILFLAGLILLLNMLWLLVGFPFMLRLDNFAKHFRFVIAFILASIVMILVFNAIFQFILEPLREYLEPYHHFRLRGAPARERLAALADPLAIGAQWAGYVTWGWLQQFIFAGYFGVLFSRAFPVEKSRWEVTKACLCTATAFSLVHLPNFWLMVFTFFGGFFGTFVFLQSHNLFILGVSHGFAGSLLNKITPINFSVGASQMPK